MLQIFPGPSNLIELGRCHCLVLAESLVLRSTDRIALDVFPSKPIDSATASEMSIGDLSLFIAFEELSQLGHTSLN